MKTMKLVLITAALTILACSACGSPANPTSISSAGLYIDPEGSQPTDKYDTLSVFYCLVTLDGLQSDKVVQASWVAADTDRAEPDFVIKIEEIRPSITTILFQLQNEGHFWPAGTYALYLYLDGKLDRVIEFEVIHDYFSG